MPAKLVLVTGASSGIGEATAKLYASRGAEVLLVARNQERLEGVAAAIRRRGGTASTFPADLSDSQAVTELAARIGREWGTPDIVINNAGAGVWRPLIDTTPEAARAMIEVPYLAAFYLTHAFLPAMLKRRSGSIVFVTSPASYLTWPNACGYIAARRALRGLAEGLRSELHRSGIDVGLVVLGDVDTPYWQHNPGSRENMPKANRLLLPMLSAEQAAETIAIAVSSRRRLLVRPWFYRVLFLLNALMPNLVAAQLRRASRQATRSRSSETHAQ